MRRALYPIVCSGLLLITLPCLGLAPSHHRIHATIRRAALLSHLRTHASARAVAHHEAAPAMDPDRATQIQSALIRSGYLSGPPSGTWDAGSVAAMQKLQSDNGWQTKLVPDARALIKLGLGPAQDTAAAQQNN